MRAVVLRAVLYGVVLGAVAFSCASIALTLVPDDIAGAATVVSTLLVALAVGAWAGDGEESEDPRPSQRWVGAAAFIAAAGTFGSFLQLYQALLPGRGWILFAALIIGLAVPLYALGMILAELLDWARAQAEEEPDHTFEPGKLVVQGMIGGLAAGVVLTGLLAFSGVTAGTILIGSALVLLIPLALRNPGATRSRETILYETVSAFGHLQVSEVAHPGERQAERRLYLNGEEESGQLVRSGAPTLAYIAAAETWLSSTTPSGSSYLFLGGGAYTLPRRISERDARARIVVVELDPEVTRIAQHFFGLGVNSRIQTVNGDARAYLERGEPDRFDRIYVDVYAGAETLPFSLVTEEAAEAMKARLDQGGVLGMNLIAQSVGDEQKALWSIVRTYEGVFPSVALYVHLGKDYPERQNLMLLAGLEEGMDFPRSTGGFERWPREDWPELDGVITYRDLGMEALQPGESPASPRPAAARRQRMG